MEVKERRGDEGMTAEVAAGVRKEAERVKIRAANRRPAWRRNG